jgi:probable phosphoglycerate mutase
MTLLYLMRHGAIDWPEAADCFMGQTDAPLGPVGRVQAQAWRNAFEAIEFAGVWSSDLARAADYAGILFKGRSEAVQTCGELREIDLGEWDGLPRRWVRENHPDLWRARGADMAGFRPPEGESFSDLERRVLPHINRIVEETRGAVCIVTHAGVIRVLICRLLHAPLSNLFRIRIDCGSLSLVAYSPERIEVCALNLSPPALQVLPGQGERRQA